MNNFGKYITPIDYWDLYHTEEDGFNSLKEVVMASKNDDTCVNCDEKVWKLANTGMCFSCTSGESDASDDFELI